VSLLLLAYAAWLSVQTPLDTASHFLQAALAGAGCFAVSFLAHQIASRQANVELRAQRSQLAARVQKQVNELVIESLSDGILVVDQRRTVRAANPAARQLLGAESALQTQSFDLASMVGWQGLVDIMSLSFARQSPQSAAINIHHPGQGPRRLQVRTQLTATQDTGTGSLCVMFLKDLREIEAQMRADKLASMGRMSAAVAHEIRNPLAAISQANALLEEDITDPRHKQLTQMVQQNAKRLEKIVEEILNVSRLQHMDSASVSFALALNPSVERICRDWQQHSGIAHAFTVDAHPTPIEVRFEAEHLRQILINLLDNARRYASGQAGAIQLWTELSGSAEAQLSVWSDGQPMDQSVERHLFEPFFSSESRSSGLGLYVCRELCERHGASIAYHRTTRLARGKRTEGNEFRVRFQSPQPAGSPHTAASAINTNA
jgi:two-component system sensor histidine kinase PilS (NtrC family)